MTQKTTTTSRRGFLKTVAAISTGVVIDRSGAQAANTQTKASPDKWIVPKRPFGDTGVQVPILSLGGMFNTGRNLLLLKQAVKWGVTYWDTAARYEYWGSETGIGEYFTKYPEDRKKIFLVSKAYTLDPSRLDQYLDTSLDNLKTDYIDLYFIHSVDYADDLKPKEFRMWAEKAKASGKIKFFGFSTHKNMPQNLLEGAKLGFIDGIMSTYNYRFMQNDEMKRGIEACAKAGVGLTAMKTQAEL